MRGLIPRIVLALAGMAAAGDTAAASPPMAPLVASIGLCADQAVAILVPPDRIAGLSAQARDPALSVVAEQAQTLPSLPISAEAVLLSGAEVVAANYYGDIKTVTLLQRLGRPVVRVASAESFAETAAALIETGQALDAEDRARALADSVTRRARSLHAQAPEPPLPAAYYRPDGGSAGAGTFVSGAMRAAGLDSLSTRLGQQGWGRLDLETLVLHMPRAFVLSFFGSGPYSARQSFARHPVTRRLLAELPVIQVPGRLWSCGGWPLIDAAETMAAQLREKMKP